MTPSSLKALVEFNPFKREWCEVKEGLNLRPSELVIVNDGEGEDLGKVLLLHPNRQQLTDGMVVRRANGDELKSWSELKKEAELALGIFQRLKKKYNLNIKVITVHWRLDKTKVCFYFISEKSLNFRKFHKDLAAILKESCSAPPSLRVAIKQIGMRDYTRYLGGIGLCGRVICCHQLLWEMKPITLRMARQQKLFVDPSKISGFCGKLLCCLAYEKEAYQELIGVKETESKSDEK